MNINEEAFAKLLFRLEPGLIDSDARYKRLRLKMMKFFLWKRCEEAEDLADETISRVVSQITSGIQIESPYSYIYAIANNVYNEFIRGQIRKEKLLVNLVEQSSEPEETQGCREHCLKNLPVEKLKLIKRYYQEPKDRESQAQEMEMTLNALRLLVHRVKKELRACYEKCNK